MHNQSHFVPLPRLALFLLFPRSFQFSLLTLLSSRQHLQKLRRKEGAVTTTADNGEPSTPAKGGKKRSAPSTSAKSSPAKSSPAKTPGTGKKRVNAKSALAQVFPDDMEDDDEEADSDVDAFVPKKKRVKTEPGVKQETEEDKP